MNSEIYQWAARHNIGIEALFELQGIFHMQGGDYIPEHVHGVSEEAVASVLLLEASRKDVRLFRNNVGVLRSDTGRPVRYGLANESNKVNAILKSGDYIGWRPVLIQHHHVGTTIAQFVSRETKKVGWHYVGDEHEQAQLAWLQLVISDGGDAAFCTGEGTL